MEIDLSTEKGYDLACGLRGPDQDAPCVKWVLNGRLRALAECGPYGKSYMLRESAALEGTEPDAEGEPFPKWDRYMSKAPSFEFFMEDARKVRGHYFVHMRDAFAALQRIATLTPEQMKEAENLWELADKCAQPFIWNRALPKESDVRPAWDALFGEEDA